ncbi:MAG: hypothetical protein KGJ57_10805 [Sphingomonadales bacterium]|nr:hypothetical protein [Sphingomonadales bacterium]MDE2169902.1 hypothetical protein [Sphingomonadales bacterium]
MIRTYLLAAMASGLVAMAVASPAQAREGCGRGWHRGPAGHCRPNVPPPHHGRPGVAIGVPGGPALVIGRFYPGRGYWDGRRYWHHRERWHGRWRYR